MRRGAPAAAAVAVADGAVERRRGYSCSASGPIWLMKLHKEREK